MTWDCGKAKANAKLERNLTSFERMEPRLGALPLVLGDPESRHREASGRVKVCSYGSPGQSVVVEAKKHLWLHNCFGRCVETRTLPVGSGER